MTGRGKRQEAPFKHLPVSWQQPTLATYIGTITLASGVKFTSPPGSISTCRTYLQTAVDNNTSPGEYTVI